MSELPLPPVSSDDEPAEDELVDGPLAPRTPRDGHLLGSAVVVLVCHEAEHYLPRSLTAVAALDPAPSAVVAVDVGSTDRTAELLAGSPAVTRVVSVDSATGFAAAVHAGVDAAPHSDWLWVLHDDSAPEPDALGVLLASAAEQHSVAIWGPKVVGWDEPRRLLEVGVSISRSGRRFTGLERGEQDQGQFDGQRDVLAVGSAGLLARRDVWSDLGGFDKALHRFREDVDLGWRVNLAGHRVCVETRSVLHHAEATARGRRGAVDRDPVADDRSSAVFTILANSAPVTVPLRWLWLLLLTLARALAFALGKSPHEAAAEMSAVGGVLLRPGRVLRSRRARRRWRKVPPRQLRSLFPPPGLQLRHTLESAATILTVPTDAGGGPSTILESGPVDDDIDSFVAAGTGRLRRWLRRPGVLLFLGLLLVQLVAWRGLYRGGVLHGGALLPVPTGASDLWQAYTAAWHPVTLGSDTMAHPSTAILGLLATVAFGHASWVVPSVLVLGPPVAGLLAYQATRTFGLTLRLRVWLGAAYALNPVLLAATAQGRWSTVLAGVLLPLVGIAMARALAPADGSARATAMTTLLLASLLAVAPTLVVPLAVLVAVLVVRLAGRRRVLALVTGVVPLLVLLPWWPVVAGDPTVLLLEPGVRLSEDGEPPWQVLFLDPGGWWSLPWWLGIGVAVTVLAAVLRAQGHRPVRLALALTAVAMGWALVLESLAVTPSTSAVPVAPWSGAVLVLAAAAGLLAAALAARGSRRRLSRSTFTWRQPVLVAVTLLAVASPMLWATQWLVRGASDPLARGDANPLPAFVRAQSALPEQIRTLVLRPEDGRLAYTVLRSRDARWGDVETAPAVDRLRGLDEVVADLASGRGAAPVDELTERAVQYVLVVPPVETGLEEALDSAPGLLRIANPGESALWRIQQETGRVRLVTSDGERAVLASAVSGDPAAAEVEVPSAGSDRVLELSELADDGWRAEETTGSGTRELSSRSVSDWAQRFVVGAEGSSVAMTVQNPIRRWALWAQLAVVAVLVLVALPSRRRQEEEAV